MKLRSNSPNRIPTFSVMLPCLVSLAMLAALPAIAQHPADQVMVEGGLALPYGNLKEDFTKTRLGFGADKGMVLGFRYRFHLSATVSISPAFHFVDLGDFEGVHPDLEEYSIQTSNLRYSVEVMVISEYRSWGRPRSFLAAGIGLNRNRVKGYYQDFIDPLDESLSSWGVSFRGGIQIIGFELSLVYNVNRFSTWHFLRSDSKEDYDWDIMELRTGWIIPLK